MENFTPFSALAGGALIGISATLLLFFNGRIAGVSGIMNGVLYGVKHERVWRALFLAGLILGAFIYQAINPGFFTPRQDYSWYWLVFGGFSVGFGTRMGNGCTSGHGVCGIGRFSKRSLVATMVFMCSGMLTVYLLRHVLEIA